MSKERADILLVNAGLAESRNRAQHLIMAGQVRADGAIVSKPAAQLPPDVQLVVDSGPPYVSRGGEKLAEALRSFAIDPTGMICADAGASTGGFSDCLLQNGADRIYAIDVGKGILHWKIRQDDRVVVMEKTNARHVVQLTEAVDLAVIDVSFISLKIILPVVHGWLKPNGQMLALIKPQFEAGRAEAAKGAGVIRDPAIHRRVLQDLLDFAPGIGLQPLGMIRSPITGPKGNVEFLVWLAAADAQPDAPECQSERWIREAIVPPNKI